MLYSVDMFNVDFADSNNLSIDSFVYAYAEAMQDIQLWDKDWSREDKYLCRILKTGELKWIHSCNSKANVKKNEVFIAAIYNSKYRDSVTVCRATGVKRFVRKELVSRDILLVREVNRVRFKRERAVYEWYDEEYSSVLEEINKANSDMKNNFTELEFGDICVENSFIFKASSKRIKTDFGSKSGAYENDFELKHSPFKGNIVSSFEKLRVKNREEFLQASFPLYEVKYRGVLYLFEKCDFEIRENKQDELNIEYVNEWEDRIISLNRKLKKIRKWRDKCLGRIKIEVSSFYGIKPELF